MLQQKFIIFELGLRQFQRKDEKKYKKVKACRTVRGLVF